MNYFVDSTDLTSNSMNTDKIALLLFVRNPPPPTHPHVLINVHKINLGMHVPGCGRFPLTDKSARGKGERGEINATQKLYLSEERSKIINM